MGWANSLIKRNRCYSVLLSIKKAANIASYQREGLSEGRVAFSSIIHARPHAGNANR